MKSTSKSLLGLLARRSILIAAVACVGLAFCSTPLRADVILPTDLQPGQEYQLIFVTSGSTTATSADINVYNTFVTQQAAISSSSIIQAATWKAVGSTTSVNAIASAPTFSDVPIYNTHGQRVANNSSDFWDGTIQNPISYDQNGLFKEDFVWTGTSPYTGVPYLNGSALGGSYSYGPITGWSNITTDEWSGAMYDNPSTMHLAYALSSPISIPEPASLALLALGGAALLLRRRKA